MAVKELHVGSLTTAPDVISIYSLLKTRSLNGGIREIHAVLSENNRNSETLTDIAGYAFGVKIKSGQVNIAKYTPDERDIFFAKEFGFTILPVAYVALKEKGVDAWVGPALIPVGHPLYHKTEKDNSVHVVSKENEDENNQGFSYYVRLKVKDQPLALSQIAEQFGNAGISIKQMRQPQDKENKGEVDMAFFLWPCQNQVLKSALDTIRGLENIVLRVNSPLKVLGGSK